MSSFFQQLHSSSRVNFRQKLVTSGLTNNCKGEYSATSIAQSWTNTFGALQQSECSPYQVVASKIYHLKQHFLLSAMAWRCT